MKTKKRLWALLLALALVLPLAGAPALADTTATVDYGLNLESDNRGRWHFYKIEPSGQVSDTEIVDPLPDNWSYDETTNTLTLTNFDFTTSCRQGLRVRSGTTIELVGRNTINSTCNESIAGAAAALVGKGNITIKGQGSLFLTGGYNQSSVAGDISAGLDLDGSDLTVDGPMVVATGGGAQGLTYGINAGNITLKNGAQLSGISNPAGTTDGYGIFCNRVTFEDDGLLTAQGRTAALHVNSQPAGVTVEAYSDFSMTNPVPSVTFADSTYQFNGTPVCVVLLEPGQGPAVNDFGLQLYPDGSFHKVTGPGTDGGAYDPAPGKWSYDQATKTLTLDGFNFSTSSPLAVQVPREINIALEGDNSITTTYSGAPSGSNLVAALTVPPTSSGGRVNITGTGTLTLVGGNNTGSGISAGLYATGALTINGAKVSATAGDSTNGFSIGIQASEGLSLENNANVAAKAGAAMRSFGARTTALSIPAGGGTLEAKGDTYALVYETTTPNTDPGLGAILADNAVAAGADKASAATEGVTVGTPDGYTYIYQANGADAKYVKISPKAPTPAGSGLTVSATALDFGGSQAAGTEASQTITIALDPSVAGSSKSISYALSGAGFRVEPAPGWSDATGGALKVIFAPGAAQAYSGTLTLTLTVDGAAKTPVAIPLSGTATGGGAPSPSPSPTPGGGGGGGGYTPPDTTVYNDPSRPKADVWITGSGLKEEDLLITERLEQGADYNFLLSLAGGADVVRVYDIRLQSGQTSLPGNALVFDLGSGYAGQAFTLLHKKADGTVEYLYGTADGSGQVRFHPIYELSPFLLAKGTLAQTGLVNIPKTGDGSGMALGALLLLTAAAGWAVSRRRKLSQK